jgi:hypothetical protein
MQRQYASAYPSIPLASLWIPGGFLWHSSGGTPLVSPRRNSSGLASLSRDPHGGKSEYQRALYTREIPLVSLRRDP